MKTKLMEVINEIQKMDIDALSETKKKESGIEELDSYIAIYSYSGVPQEDVAKRGISISIKKKYKIDIANFKAIGERIIKVNMQYSET
ncbi:hypothetical protein HUJ05_009943 [Dendroctonus ponderosae]|nr:hypothetical protein HUJ05_009943 [Dendroctonus ponderosae]